VACTALAACSGSATPQSVVNSDGSAHLRIEIATDSLIHFEFAPAGEPAGRDAAIETSPMVARTDYPGPRHFSDDGQGSFSTGKLAVSIDPASQCLTVAERVRTHGQPLTTLCPATLGEENPALTISAEATTHVYGLGEHFLIPNQPNGDLLGHTIVPGTAEGNAITAFNGGNTGNAQFPVLYAVAGDGRSYALFLDQPYAQQWDLSGDPWRVTLSGGTIRGYLIAGSDPLAVRRRYMELVGRPPVPPKKMFGLWVSEFGYDDWAELEDKLDTLRANRFPVDGFLLDLQWFGGVFRRPSYMGELRWDETRFPDPAGTVARLREQQGIGLMLIEEPYVDHSRPVYDDLATRGFFPLACDEGCGPVDLRTWWGQGSMLDFTDPVAADYWHDLKRQPLVDSGVLGHWTDLGEPETFSPDAHYVSSSAAGPRGERDVHNLYNFDWAASIQRGHGRNGTARPFILSRSGTAGIQRFGAAMWSGDIGSNMTSLATQLNVEMHMSFSGIDYFGSDVGGYLHREPDGDVDELYSVWFATSALFDVPLRPHTENLCNCRETAPDRIGDRASNLDNLRLRYRLVPYLYSLAHRAHRFGEPLIAPLVVYYPADPNVRALGDEKLVGRDLLVATATAYGQTERDVYLPAGTWVDFRTHEWLDSPGGWTRALTRTQGLIRLPLYARAGAIIPEMHVDELTMNALGLRADGSTRDELVVRVYAAAQPTQFTLYEDDGATTAYQQGAVRTTEIAQRCDGDIVRVTIEPAQGSYAGAPAHRDNVVELVVRGVEESKLDAITLNGAPLRRAASQSDFDDAAAGWLLTDDHILLLRSGAMPVAARKVFALHLTPARSP